METEEGFKALVERVRKIDATAADYLMYLNHDEGMAAKVMFDPYGRLKQIMVWNETPQGWAYWNKINEQLEQETFENIYKRRGK